MSRQTHHYEHLKQRLHALRPAFRYAPDWQGRFAQWHEEWLATLNDLLGPRPPSCDPDPQWEPLEERPRYSLHRVTYWTEPGLAATALVARPNNQPEPGPGILAIHGHNKFGSGPLMRWPSEPEINVEADRFEGDYGHRLAEHGITVWAPDLRGFGYRMSDTEATLRGAGGRDPCNINFWHQILLGEVAITSQLHDLQVALGLLADLPEVNPAQLGCAGLSYGGRLTTFLGAVDNRLKACAVCGALNSFIERIESYSSCGYQVVPGLLRHGDIDEVLGLHAPRALGIELGSDDLCCPNDVALEQFARLEGIFADAGAADRLALFRFQGGHVFRGDESIPWLIGQLAS